MKRGFSLVALLTGGVLLASLAWAQPPSTGGPIKVPSQPQAGKAPKPKDSPKKWRDYIFEGYKPKLPPKRSDAAPESKTAPGSIVVPAPQAEPGRVPPRRPGPTFPRFPEDLKKKG